VGEKASVIEMRAKGIRMLLATIRVKAYEGELHRAMQVGVVLTSLRSSMKPRALEMRPSASTFGFR
jgi:hypothetical protein